MGVWEQVEELVAAGKGVTIRLTEAQEVKFHKNRKLETRVHRERPWETYLGSTKGTTRPRCYAKGCRTYLKKDQPVACSQKCADQIIEESLRYLALLEYHLIERLDEYESQIHGIEAIKRLVEGKADGRGEELLHDRARKQYRKRARNAETRLGCG